jgi:hypothetical protein
MAKYYLQQKIVIFYLSLTDKYYPEGPRDNIFYPCVPIEFYLGTLTKYVTCKQKVTGPDRIL